jgi:hypothetical protein
MRIGSQLGPRRPIVDVVDVFPLAPPAPHSLHAGPLAPSRSAQNGSFSIATPEAGHVPHI